MVFNRGKFEWLVTLKLTLKFVSLISIKKISHGHEDQKKKNPAGLEE